MKQGLESEVPERDAAQIAEMDLQPARAGTEDVRGTQLLTNAVSWRPQRSYN